jgi:hypothetical protein
LVASVAALLQRASSCDWRSRRWKGRKAPCLDVDAYSLYYMRVFVQYIKCNKVSRLSLSLIDCLRLVESRFAAWEIELSRLLHETELSVDVLKFLEVA